MTRRQPFWSRGLPSLGRFRGSAWRLPAVVTASSTAAGSAGVVLLRRMRADFQHRGRLHRSTAAAMYSAYTAHILATVAAWTRQDLKIAPHVARAVGVPIAATGACLCVAGMRRFTSPGQLSGTADGPLVTGGIYEIGRNPQYTGYLLFLAGTGIARRSTSALALAGALAVAYRAWIPTEERHLHRVFGAKFDRYRRQTPRFLAPDPRRWLGASAPTLTPTSRCGPRRFEFTETIGIAVPAATVWAALVDIEHWWPASNPEHDSIERVDGSENLTVGTRFRIREKIAGVPGEATGTITMIEPGSAVTWETDKAHYRLLGRTFTVGEGVTWRIEPDGTRGSKLSAHVRCRFPDGPTGRGLWFIFTRLLDGIDKDRHHARTELEYLKKATEGSTSF